MVTDPVPELMKLLDQPVVFINWPRGVKGTKLAWKHLTWANMTPEYLEKLKDGNIGVALGDVSNGLCALDWDVDQFIEPFVEINPHLNATFQTHGARGCVFWFRMVGHYPQHTTKLKSQAGDDIGEFRSNGSQSIVWGIHPDTKGPYTWVKRQPVIYIPFTSIQWPSGVINPPSLQSGTVPSVPLCSSQSTLSTLSISVNSVSEAVSLSLPDGLRRNHQALFRLARALLTLNVSHPVGQAERSEAFSSWYNQTKALGFLRSTQDREHYFTEFMNALKSAAIPLGTSPIQAAWEKAQSEPEPPQASNFETPGPRKLLALCFQLEKASHGHPWYLSCRDAGKLVGISHAEAAKLLSGFAAIGFLVIVKKGNTQQATRYRFVL